MKNADGGRKRLTRNSSYIKEEEELNAPRVLRSCHQGPTAVERPAISRKGSKSRKEEVALTREEEELIGPIHLGKRARRIVSLQESDSESEF